VHSEESVYKLILGGDGAVGKTSIVKRFTENTFKKNYKATIGTSISKKECHFEGLNSMVRFVIWDLAGQPQFKRIRPSYLANSGAGILVFDVTDRESFNNIKNWYREIRKDAPSNIFLILAGNKIDLKDSREVSHSEGKALAEELGISYIETSAKTGENINEAFKMLALQLIQRYVKGEEIYKVITDSIEELEMGKINKIPENCVKIPIEQVWEDVERDLVPWLSDNIEALSDTIDFQLKPIENKKIKSDKKVLAVDDLGEKALILPQFKQTDYYHLGTLITKLAHYDVKTVIWICEEVLPEYRKTIEWLNKNTSKDILFYLIELEVLKSEEYRPFPRFRVIIDPPEPQLARRMKKMDNSLTRKQKMIIDFWIALVEKPSFPNQSDIQIQKKNRISYPSKINGIEFRYFVAEESSGVELYLNHQDSSKNVERFRTLENHKEEIEERFKEIGWNLSQELDWNFKKNRSHQVIRYTISMGLVNRESWDKIHLKLIDIMKSTMGAFEGKINTLFGND
jgi:Ras-related protein Rab-1A